MVQKICENNDCKVM